MQTKHYNITINLTSFVLSSADDSRLPFKKSIIVPNSPPLLTKAISSFPLGCQASPVTAIPLLCFSDARHERLETFQTTILPS